jgi:hypothetical protein
MKIPCQSPFPLLWVLALVIMPGGALQAQKKKTAHPREGPSVQVSAGVVFSVFEREHITAFYGQHRQSGVKPLPPGIRKNLARGKPLPPGIAKQVLPSDLEALLPGRPGYQRIQVGLDVLLVEVATGVIHDILMDVIR